MTDLEITQLCAEAMGMQVPILVWQENGYLRCTFPGGRMDFNPLHDDAQAMVLVKKFHMGIMHEQNEGGHPSGWFVTDGEHEGIGDKQGCNDLNRAICECVAKMQGAK